MKRYHVISISVLLGLIAGLSVSKAAEANTLICNKTIMQSANGVAVNAAPVVVNTKPGSASIVIASNSLAFPMHRVINKNWKGSDSKNALYEGKITDGKFYSELIISILNKNEISIQYKATGDQGEISVMGLDCSNAK